MENNFSMTAPQGGGYSYFEKKHFNKIALIDADKMKHLVAYDVANDLKNNISRHPHKLAAYIDKRIGDIFSMFSARGYIFLFSGKSYDTFRNKIAFEKEYKGSRKDDPNFYEGKIEDMAEVVSVVMKSYPTLIFSDLEADDLVCMLQTEDTFVVSNDKDLKQIPGSHFDFDKKDLVEVSEEEAFVSLMYQLLIGDSTDCITGIKGCGPKNARKIIEENPVKLLPSKILREYMKVHGITNGIDAFAENWMLVRLRNTRGTYFKEKYQSAFNLLELILQNSK